MEKEERDIRQGISPRTPLPQLSDFDKSIKFLKEVDDIFGKAHVVTDIFDSYSDLTDKAKEALSVDGAVRLLSANEGVSEELKRNYIIV